ncbi:MAG: hypothetical protein ACREBB_02895, partial [Nitrosotalea sp.]
DVYVVETIYDIFSFVNSPRYTKQMWSEIPLPDGCVKIALDKEVYRNPEFSEPNSTIFKKFIIPIVKGHHIYKIKYKFNYEPTNHHTIDIHFPVETFIVTTQFQSPPPSPPKLFIPCEENHFYPLEKSTDTTYTITLKNINQLTPIRLDWEHPTQLSTT